MPLYNFKARFADAVAAGMKCQTIRAHRKRNADPRIGDTLYLYTGIRTKRVRKLRQAVVTNVRPICLAERTNDGGQRFAIYLGSQILSVDDAIALAQRDGFNSLDEAMAFVGEVHGLPFSGILIEWQ